MKPDQTKDIKARSDVLHNLLKGVHATGNPYLAFRAENWNVRDWKVSRVPTRGDEAGSETQTSPLWTTKTGKRIPAGSDPADSYSLDGADICHCGHTRIMHTKTGCFTLNCTCKFFFLHLKLLEAHA